MFVGRLLLQYVVAKLFTSCDFFEQNEEDGSEWFPTCFSFFVCLAIHSRESLKYGDLQS